ncbi:ABC transporter permease [Actinoplanes sp. TRM 88003]|uniref:ABC transporter permease n=1 Tax=Paractinoplanes aksuensis TaxID=2939490 RepID=A0ABT1DGP4_9ACTN|nr:FtsX-like permease family protein [Actinoplanes aksuensis]MCO8269241.1 ABC transporter permease [Actinoplanes aksuensis]
MIRLGLRLTLAGGREALVRLVVIALAMALGVGLLLAALAGLGGVSSQNDRYGWANSTVEAGPDPLWWQTRIDGFDSRTIGRVDLAATGPQSPVPPGLPRLPGPGEYFASPALAELIATTPRAELADRYPGRLAGTIGDEALPSPDSLVAVAGWSPAELSQRPGVRRVGTIASVAPTSCPGGCWAGIPTAGLQLILGVVAAALIFPLFILVGTTTRLAATRREQRFAAMRLVGATPRQVGVVSAVEATVSAVAGTALGFGLFLAFRDALAAIPFTGAPMFPADLALGLPLVPAVALGVPVLAALAALVALRRVRVSPLGITRRAAARPPRAWRIVPLLAGLAELSYFVGRRPSTTDGQIVAYLSGILVVMIGLVVAGPWLTMAVARIAARRANGTAALIAARRLAGNPKAGFRSVSGLVIALFVMTVAVGIMGSLAADRPAAGSAHSSVLHTIFREGLPAPTGDPVPAALKTQPGVREIAVTRHPPADRPPPEVPLGDWGWPTALVSCADLAAMPSNGRCAPGAGTAWVYNGLEGPEGWDGVWPTADVAPDRLPALAVDSIVTYTDGSRAALERARTTLSTAHPMLYSPYTDAEWNAESARTFEGWQRLADVVVLTSLAVAGCSLAVGIAAGLSERKRPFSLLRLTGVPLRTLRRVVALESVTPLLAAAAVALGAGLLAAHLFLRAQMQISLHPPGLSFYATVLGGLAASLAVISLTLPLLRQITGPEAARGD